MNQKRLAATGIALLVLCFLSADAWAMYQPVMGRFMQRDPGAGGMTRIGAGGPASGGQFAPRDQYADGMNLYQYVRGNPIAKTDPSGLSTAIDHGGTVGKVTVSQNKALSEDGTWGRIKRGMYFAAKWSPPTGGDWDKECKCKPCQRVQWIQNYSEKTWWGEGDFTVDWGPDDTRALKHNITDWNCNNKNSTRAEIADQPNQEGYVLWDVEFRAITVAICMEGKQKGKVYAWIYWGYSFDSDTGKIRVLDAGIWSAPSPIHFTLP